ncbi:hypothetical protein Tco_1512718 [Tanacetum coccineum]
MAITNSCNKHNMIACVEKTERNADFHEVIDFLTGCYVNYALLVSPDVIQKWIQQFWNTTKERMINEVTHIEAKIAGKKILVSEASVHTDLMFNDEDGTNCFDNQVIWNTLRDIGYEGSLILLSFSKPLFSPQWKYLVHTLLHCLSSKNSLWDQFGTNIASALVGLATNQKFNFSKLIFDGMLWNLKDSKPFLMYPRYPWRMQRYAKVCREWDYDTYVAYLCILGECKGMQRYAENGTMIHMLVEQRYPLTRELMQRMLEHKLEVQKETEDALNVIRFVMKQKEDLEREEE